MNDINLPRANTMPGGSKNGEKSETSTGPSNLEKSRTERRRQSSPRNDPTSQLFDDKISVKKKVWVTFYPTEFDFIDDIY